MKPTLNVCVICKNTWMGSDAIELLCDNCKKEEQNNIYRLQKETYIKLINKTVDINNKILGGKPVLKNTRFPISRIIAELTDDNKISDICNDYNLDQKLVEDFFIALSFYFEIRGVNNEKM